MADDQEHLKQVDKWMKRARGLSPSELLELFDRAMNALWTRAQRTLGEVTLSAIADRVFVNASEVYAPFEGVRIEASGIDCRELRKRASEVDDARELEKAIRFVLLEFLMVIGNLTGELLTPALHGELSKVTPKESGAGDEKGKP